MVEKEEIKEGVFLNTQFGERYMELEGAVEAMLRKR